MLVALALAPLAGAQTLTLTGSCPGLFDLEVSGVTAGGSVAILYTSRGEGEGLLPGGPCRDTAVDILEPRFAASVRDTDLDGIVRLRPAFRPETCGAIVQAVDLETCTTTNLDTVSRIPPFDGLLLSEWSVPTVHHYDLESGALSVFHTATLNDVDCNVAEGSPLAWFVEHGSDDIGSFVPGSGDGVDVRLEDTDYHYPKHIALHDRQIVVMDRNNCTLERYDLAMRSLGNVPLGCTSGQGVATDGEHLFVSTWSPPEVIELDASFVEVARHPFPSGMSGDNLVDFAYHPRSETWWGMDASGESGTGTYTSTLVEFTMGGEVLSSIELGINVDGLGAKACR